MFYSNLLCFLFIYYLVAFSTIVTYYIYKVIFKKYLRQYIQINGFSRTQSVYRIMKSTMEFRFIYVLLLLLFPLDLIQIFHFCRHKNFHFVSVLLTVTLIIKNIYLVFMSWKICYFSKAFFLQQKALQKRGFLFQGLTLYDERKPVFFSLTLSFYFSFTVTFYYAQFSETVAYIHLVLMFAIAYGLTKLNKLPKEEFWQKEQLFKAVILFGISIMYLIKTNHQSNLLLELLKITVTIYQIESIVITFYGAQKNYSIEPFTEPN